MMNTPKAFCATFALCLGLGAAPGLTESSEASIVKAGFVEEQSGSERINFSGKLRMLSQRIPAAACFANASIEPEKTAKMMASAAEEFELILQGLEYGEPKLNIRGTEKDRRVLAALKEVHHVWDPLLVSLKQAKSAGTTDDLIQTLANKSHPLLEQAKGLVTHVSAEYADPAALLQADAITIDLAGRQRMLAQRMSKNICMLQSGIDTERALKHLSGAKAIYDTTLRALRFGAPQVGLEATKNEEILAGLDEILTLWESLEPTVSAVEAGGTLEADQMAAIYNGMNSLTGKMNVLVGKYSEASKLGL